MSTREIPMPWFIITGYSKGNSSSVATASKEVSWPWALKFENALPSPPVDIN